MITAAQLRAARVLLGIDQRRLAELSGLSVPTIQRMEASETMVRGNVDSLVKLITALEDAGIALIDDGMTIREAEAMMRATPYPTCIEVEPILERLIGERVGPGWRETVRRKIGRIETCTHLMELLGPAVTTLYQTMSYGKKPQGRDTLENQQNSGERPFFVGGCHSWRTDGPIVAAMFPQFATKPAAKD